MNRTVANDHTGKTYLAYSHSVNVSRGKGERRKPVLICSKNVPTVGFRRCVSDERD